MRTDAGSADEGSGSVLVLGLVAVLLVGALGTATVGRAAAARHRAASAADLAALAAAGAAWDVGVVAAGSCSGPVLEAATSTAARNGAVVDSCDVGADGDARVAVSVEVGEVGGPLAGLGPARASARAGPAVP